MNELHYLWMLLPLVFELFLNTGVRLGSARRLTILGVGILVVLAFHAYATTYGSIPWMASASLIAAGFAASLAGLTAPKLQDRIELLMGAWIPLLGLLAGLGLGAHGSYLFACYASCGGFYVVAGQLTERIQLGRNPVFCSQESAGLGIRYPSTSELILTSLLLIGCTPGSLLFFVEDEALNLLLQDHLWIGVAVVISTLLISLVAYRAYAEAFYGNGPEGPQADVSIEGRLTRYRYAIAFLVAISFKNAVV